MEIAVEINSKNLPFIFIASYR